MCALVGSHLNHRPHVWLSGYPGKSWFMNHIQDAIHQHRYHHSAFLRDTRAFKGGVSLLVIDGADYRDTNNVVNKRQRQGVQKMIDACRAASGRFEICGSFGPLCFSACIMSWEQPEMTRYETRQFAPVRLSDAMSYQEFSRYESETKKIMGDNDLIGELQQSILYEAEEIAERAVALERAAEEEVGNEFRQVEICAIRGALSAGWQWWSGTCDPVGYWAAERPISGTPE